MPAWKTKRTLQELKKGGVVDVSDVEDFVQGSIVGDVVAGVKVERILAGIWRDNVEGILAISA